MIKEIERWAGEILPSLHFMKRDEVRGIMRATQSADADRLLAATDKVPEMDKAVAAAVKSIQERRLPDWLPARATAPGRKSGSLWGGGRTGKQGGLVTGREAAFMVAKWAAEEFRSRPSLRITNARMETIILRSKDDAEKVARALIAKGGEWTLWLNFYDNEDEDGEGEE